MFTSNVAPNLTKRLHLSAQNEIHYTGSVCMCRDMQTLGKIRHRIRSEGWRTFPPGEYTLIYPIPKQTPTCSRGFTHWYACTRLKKICIHCPGHKAKDPIVLCVCSQIRTHARFLPREPPGLLMVSSDQSCSNGETCTTTYTNAILSPARPHVNRTCHCGGGGSCRMLISQRNAYSSLGPGPHTL